MLAGIPPSRRKVAMPVYVESITQPSPQDLTDLAKIYADAPDWLLAPYSSADTLIAAALADGSLIAGRFNDRLLGAALLQRGDDAWRLSHLCVRKLTRKRGVGRRLLEETQRQASEAGKPLRLAAPAGHLEASALAARTHLPLDPL
ncbi:Acetyltransferase%2C GNAT family [Streptococcus pneumoniae]|jgi:GNAT superfamily N-acetyltransferase|nr:putative acetyltransferase [Stutzerimonas stutzeri]CJL15077.1 Acetyltransferase%2C GNAT family [Streptococcus pneumoniae]